MGKTKKANPDKIGAVKFRASVYCKHDGRGMGRI